MCVCRAAQESGVHAIGVSILTGTTKSQFSRIRSSVIPGTKFTVEVPFTQRKPHSKFEEDSFSHSGDTSNQTLEKISCFFSSFRRNIAQSVQGARTELKRSGSSDTPTFKSIIGVHALMIDYSVFS